MFIIIYILGTAISLGILYLIIQSAINNSDLVSEIREVKWLLNDIKKNQIEMMDEEDEEYEEDEE